MEVRKLVEEFDELENANLKEVAKKLNKKAEGFLPTYDIIGTIIEDKKGYNIVDNENKKMLIKSYPSLKQMLLDLANNM